MAGNQDVEAYRHT